MTDGIKKGIVWFFIIVGIFLFLVFGIAVVMMIAPGLEIFGVKFISAKIGNYHVKNTAIYNKDIVIKTDSVPINIYFSDNVGIEYQQEFQGFTMSSNTPSLSITNADGLEFDSTRDSTVYINVGQYKKFIWANTMKEFYLNIGLPTGYSATHSIKIESNSSSVALKGYSRCVDFNIF